MSTTAPTILQPPLELMPPDTRWAAPPLGTQARDDDTLVHQKLLAPWTHLVWYVTGYDPIACKVEGIHWNGVEVEWGSWSLDDVAAIESPEGVRVERDLWWWPVNVRRVRQAIQEGVPL